MDKSYCYLECKNPHAPTSTIKGGRQSRYSQVIILESETMKKERELMVFQSISLTVTRGKMKLDI